MSRLSRLINKLAPVAAVAAPILGGLNPALGAGLSIVSRLGAQPQQPTFMPTQVSMAAAPYAARLGAAAGALLGIARTVGGKIKGVWLAVAGGAGQKFISRKKAVALAKRVGLDAAALALGISAVEMSEMILDDASAGRRGKGITARNIRTTKRVIGQVQRIHCQLGLRRGAPRARACA